MAVPAKSASKTASIAATSAGSVIGVTLSKKGCHSIVAVGSRSRRSTASLELRAQLSRETLPRERLL
jgi:hypothetical protein